MSVDKEFFANNVHNYIVYDDMEETLKKYERRIVNELAIRNLSHEYFQNKVILDVGTGFQGIIALRLGAKYVYK